MSEQTQTTIIWPPLIRRCVVDLVKIVNRHKSPEALDIMAARLQTLLDDHAKELTNAD